MGTSRQNTGPTRRSTLNVIPDIYAQIHAPFDRLEETEVRDEVRKFMKETALDTFFPFFEKGTFIAQNERAFEGTRDDGLSLTAEEKEILHQEATTR